MKKVLLALCTLLCVASYAQVYQWAKAEGKFAYDYGYGIGTDQAGNLYVAGKFEEDQAVFSGSTVPCQGNHDIWIARYTSAGALTWVKTGGGPHGDYAEGLSMGSNYVLIGGEIEGANEMITFPGSTITLTAYGDNDIFFAKYDLDGNLLWAKSDGTYSNKSEKALCITHDGSDNIYIAGYFTDTTKINGTLVPGQGGHDIYVAKYDPNGVFQWIRTAGSAGRDEVKGIKCDASGNVYITGIISNGCKFGSQTLTTYNNTNYFDVVVAKYASDGSLVWVKNHGSDYDDVGWSLAIDNNGKVLVAGEFNAYADFGGGNLNLTTNGNADAFIAAYNSDGSVAWTKQVGGPLIDRARGIGTDGDNIYITGQFGGTITVGSTLMAADSSDIFVAGFDNSGNTLWSASVQGPPDAYEDLGYESGNAVCSPGNGVVYFTGGLLDGGNFGSIAVAKRDRDDAFIARVDGIVGLRNLGGLSNRSLTLFPNPTTGKFTVSGLGAEKASVQVLDVLGREVMSSDCVQGTVLDLSSQRAGVYFINVKASGTAYGARLVLSE